MRQKRTPSPIYLDAIPDHAPIPVEVRRRRKLIAFGWYGGKFSHLDWILPILSDCHHYCEPFGGSAAVLLNRTPAAVETYNDLDGEVVNFFRVLRSNADALVREIALTPFSREEFFVACTTNGDPLPDLERARRFYIRARQARSGLAQKASVGRWANCKETSRSGMSGVVSRWFGGVPALWEIAERISRVQIENRPALDVIALYDSPSTMFYCDPPYPHESRSGGRAYGYELSDDEHCQLAGTISRRQGKCAVSGYRCDIMDTLYRNFQRIDAAPKACHSSKTQRQEALWVNYEPPDEL